MLKIELNVKDGPSITGNIELNEMSVNDLPNGVKSGYGSVLLQDSGVTYAHGLIWSYWRDSKLWHEVVVTNASIESPAGFFEADYSVSITLMGTEVSTQRTGAKFYDGTGYVEYFGEPFLAPLKGADKFYNRYTPDNSGPLLEAAMLSNWSAVDAYPQEDWNATDWSGTQFDKAKNTHQTGSPRNVSGAVTQAVFLGVLSDRLDSLDLGAEELEEAKEIGEIIKEITGNIFGFIGQQSRRPYHFLHDEGSGVYAASAYNSSSEKLVMGENGPATTWGGNVFWGRNAFSEEEGKNGPYNGWDLEHFSIDMLIVGYIFYGSQYCFMQIRLLLEALMTQPHIFSDKETHSPRVWGYSLQALVWGKYVNPFEQDNARYTVAIDNLLAVYEKYAHYSPIPYAFPSYADKRHIYPNAKEMLNWYKWFELELPSTLEYASYLADYESNTIGKKESENLATYLVNNLHKSYNYKELFKCLEFFGFVPPFQIATMAGAVNLYYDMIPSGDHRLHKIAQHILLCLLTKARNPEGTFWYDYGTQHQTKTSGSGKETNGVTAWVAGGIGMLWQFVPVSWHEKTKEAIFSVYLDNKYITPGTGFFCQWYMPTAYHLGYPDEIKG